MEKILTKKGNKLLAYKRKQTGEKTVYVEFVSVIKSWKEKEYVWMTTSVSGFSPFFLELTRKEWRKIKNNPDLIMKKYTETIDKLFKDAKEGTTEIKN